MIFTNRNILGMNSGNNKKIKSLDVKDDDGLIYGDENDESELQNVQNPYYHGNVRIVDLHATASDSPSSNQTEAITLTKNVYYEL